MTRVVIPIAGILAGLGSPLETAREIRLAMGTVAEVHVSGSPAPEEALGEAFERIAETEKALSIWVEDSEISRLNAAGELVLSDLAYDAVAAALAIAEASGGAFDPTLAPGGFRSVLLDETTRRAVLRNGRTLDLGGLAKGLAADRALAALEARATGGLVDLGTSSLALFGEEPVTIEMRDPAGGHPPASFRLARGTVGSSSREQRGDHIEKTRSEIGGPALAVTVICDSALEADALSTAVFVLGVEKGLSLVQERGASGLVLVDEGGSRTLWTSPGFAERYALDVAEGVAIRVWPES